MLFKVVNGQLVLLAMGFLGPEKYIAHELDLDLDPRGNYETPNGKYITSTSKIFAAGGTATIQCDSLIIFVWCLVMRRPNQYIISGTKLV